MLGKESRIGCLWILLGICTVPCGCRKNDAAPSTTPEANPSSASSLFDVDLAPRSQPNDAVLPLRATRFNDVAGALGLRFVYDNGAQGKLLMVEATGGGCGWLDYDADGMYDLYCAQGGKPDQGPHPKQPLDQLFRQVDHRFVNVTPSAGLEEFHYSQGVAVGDFDNDGFDDIYVTNIDRNTLWHNQGDGTFIDVTESSRTGDTRWSSTAAWADLDLDGDLDLYVCNYTIYDPLHPIPCVNQKGEPSICHPKDVDPWPDECFINQGDGTFTAESHQRGLYGEGNKGLSVAIADFTNDGYPDLYVANDTTANFFFRNTGDAHFVEEARLRGCAVDRNGARQASMGLGVGDYNHDGRFDIYSTHFRNESNTLYQNRWPGGFDDVTGLEGLHEPTLDYLGFGTVMMDFDQDGRDELFVANGHIDSTNPQHAMRPQLFKFNGATTRPTWLEFSDQAGPYFQQTYVGRGVAAADFDEDGDIDLAVVHQNQPMALLRNDSERGHWIKLRFRGRANNRRGINVRVTLEQNGKTRLQELCGGTSYAVTHEPMLIFGLGEDVSPVKLTIRWPLGQTQVLDHVPVDQVLWIDERNATNPN